ncbi:MAG: hypothetical protein PW788_09400 [Micavibrio sp.]|nr:hypothetical protein [Micavibrio sp.]
MADQNHQRADKLTSYLASSGAISGALWVLGVAVSFPLAGIAIGAGAVALAVTDKGRNFLQKAGDQLLNLGNDTLSHLTEDYSRAQSWWQRRTEARKAAKAAPVNVPAPQEQSAFKGISNAPAFNQTATPGAVQTTTPEEKPAPKPIIAPKL